MVIVAAAAGIPAEERQAAGDERGDDVFDGREVAGEVGLNSGLQEPEQRPLPMPPAAMAVTPWAASRLTGTMQPPSPWSGACITIVFSILPLRSATSVKAPQCPKCAETGASSPPGAVRERQARHSSCHSIS